MIVTSALSPEPTLANSDYQRSELTVSGVRAQPPDEGDLGGGRKALSGMGAGGPGRRTGHLGRGIMGTESFSPEGLGHDWSPPILDASCPQGQAGPPC